MGQSGLNAHRKKKSILLEILHVVSEQIDQTVHVIISSSAISFHAAPAYPAVMGTWYMKSVSEWLCMACVLYSPRGDDIA